MYATPYLQIAEQLDKELNKPQVIAEHGRLNFIARFNNQFSSESQENALPKPAILIQFQNTTWKTQGKNIQKGSCTLVIHVGYHTIADDNYYSFNKEEALKVDAYVDLVHKALQGFSADCLGAMDRVGSESDEDHDHVFVEKLNYTTELLDNSTNTDANRVEVEPELKVQGEKVESVHVETPYVVRVKG